MFSKETYTARRTTLKALLKGETGLAVFIGNVEAPAQYKDNCYKFRQDSSWLYFWGINEPFFAAIIDLESGSETIFADDVEKIFGKRPWQSRSEELLEAQMRADAERMAEERAKELEAKGEQSEQSSSEGVKNEE